MVINGLSSMEKQKHKQQPEQEQKKWEKRVKHEPRFKGLFQFRLGQEGSFSAIFRRCLCLLELVLLGTAFCTTPIG